ncbi:MAG: PAS domain S-box protein [Betaproteobacteria bacterium]|nr:PAS domain S-box protein [Betaproteobacteria bacterium]
MVISLAENMRVEAKRKIAYDIADDHGRELQKQLDHSLSATYALAAVLRQGNGKIDHFETLAGEMLALYPGVSSLQLAPNGVVSQVVPRAGNEPVIGHDLLKDPDRNKEALAAIKTGKLTLAGPFDLIQGGIGIVGRLPVFLPDRDNQDRFWGFAIALIRIEDLASAARVQQLSDEHYRYELSLMRFDTGQRLILDTSALTGLADPVVYQIEVPNGTWTLAIEPVGGWHSFAFLMVEGAMALVAGLLVAFMVYSALRRPLVLQQEVKRRTRELEETGIRLEAEITERKLTDQALRESEERFRDLTELSSDWYWEQDENFRFTVMSESLLEKTGISPADYIGKTRWEVSPLALTDAEWEAHKAVLNARQPFHNLEYGRADLEGNLCYIRMSGRPIFDNDGNFRGYRGVGKNVTEHKRAEEQLRKLSRATEQSPATVVITDHEGNIEYVNPKFIQLTGYSLEEVKGKNPRILKSGDNPPEVYTDLWKTVTSGREWRGELLNRKKSGELFWEDERISPVRNEQGRITHFVAVKEDITERKRTEEELRRYNRTLRMLTECNQVLIRATQETELLDNICREIVDVGGYRMVWVGFAEHDEVKSVRPVAHAGAGKEYLDTLKVTWADIERGQGPTGIAIRSGETVITRNIQAHPHLAPWHQVAGKIGLVSALSLPLRDRGDTFGALSIFTADADVFDAKEVELLTEMADDLAYGIVSLRTREQHRRAVAALRESEERLRKIIVASPIAIIVPDEGGIVRMWNPAAERLFGWSEQEVVNQPNPVVKQGKEHEYFALLDRARRGESLEAVERRRQRKDGSFLDVIIYPSALRDARGEVTGIMGMFVDITAHKQAKAREAMELAVTRITAESDTLADALPKIIQTICETLGWDCGARWSLEADGNVLRCVETWGIPSAETMEFLALSRQITRAPGSAEGGLVKRAFSSGAPCWIADVTQDASFLRAPIAAKAGLHGAFAFPILLGDRVLGVFEFFCRAIRQPDEALIQMTRIIGGQIGQFMGRRQAEESLRLRDRAIESSTNAIMISDSFLPDNPIIYVNPAFERVSGYPAQEAIGRNGRFLVGNERDQRGLDEIRAALHEKREGQAMLRCYRKDGSLFWNELSVAPVRDETGQVTHFVSVMNDISDRKRYEEELERHANYDSLTGLPNRNLLGDRLRQGIIHAHRNQMEMAVLLVDLDHFKLVNDSMGHSVGDLLLKTVAGRLQNCLREGDTVARLGGDEFVLVISVVTRDGSYPAVIQRILAEMARPVILEDGEITITCSIGASLYPKDGGDEEVLLRNADAAMYQAKEQGRNTFRFYTAEMNARISERLTLATKLRRALDQEQFVLYYQPKVDLKSGGVSGVEALIRWNSPDKGLVPPHQFIPILEETGLIVEVGKWALRKAASTYQEWLAKGLGPLRIAVNISPLQLRQKNFVKDVEDALRGAGNALPGLDLEITESLVMEHIEENIGKLKSIREMGFGIAIDDFGTGYSSLSYLAKLPVDVLKIDRAFIVDMVSNSDDWTLVSTIISLAHSLKLKVVAEGVETEEQANLLRLLRCDEAQGYLFSPPLPTDQFKDWQAQFLLGQTSKGRG